jgi:superfamily I DNA/RNA helicase
MAARHLINPDGSAFSADELKALATELDALNDDQRKDYRNQNATAIATLDAPAILIVAGPGTGKSTLFKQRIVHWLERDAKAKILALSFVRKLVADLAADIQTDTNLTDAQRRQVDVFTLHKYARSVVEKNNGTKQWSFARHIRVIVEPWKEVVWADVLLLNGRGDNEAYSWKSFEKQLHDAAFDEAAVWHALQKSYFELCRFYNAAGFSDLIIRATDALTEDPKLNEHHFFIIDEYQDFNAAEEKLLERLTDETEGKLIVGDDDQVLYETLKSGKASLIRGIYTDHSVVNALLPFCGRCDFHITSAADHFISQEPDPESIKKIYLAIAAAGETKKVQVIACATPITAVDYIRTFIESHEGAIKKRQQELASGDTKDAYLLILSPSKAVNFFKPKGARDDLLNLIKPYSEIKREYSEEYYMVLNYYALAKFPANNFTFRKVLHHEGLDPEKVSPLLQMCLQKKASFSSLTDDAIKAALAKASKVQTILDSQASADKKVEALAKEIAVANRGQLQTDLEKKKIDDELAQKIEHQDDEDAELEEIEVRQMSAIELMTIVSSKGLSADHVIIIGFDNVNMQWITRNAFFVAMSRARKSLHLVTALSAGGATEPHKFLSRLPDANIEFSKYTKGKGAEQFRGRLGFDGYIKSLTAARRHWQRPR